MLSLIAGLSLAVSIIPPYQDVIEANTTEVKGKLVITGGSLGRSNEEIYEEFIKDAGGTKKAKIGIIPAASNKLQSSREFKEDLKHYGVKGKSVEILPISNHDFSDTSENEANWKDNVNQKSLAEKIKGLTAIWFVGGDQIKITKSLLKKGGKQTAALEAIWSMYKRGATLGGTSAGAAIMSDRMITGGDSLGALKGEKAIPRDHLKEYEHLKISKGLGFFQYGIVDQHFDERSRLGRLTAAALQYEKQKNQFFSYGIDEDTAMVVDNLHKNVKIVGRGSVTAIDTSHTSIKEPSHIEGVDINLLSPGDEVNLIDRKITISPSKSETKGYEYYSFKPLPATGGLTPYGRLKNYLAYSLADNSSAKKVDSYVYESSGKGFKLTFRKTAETNGYWGYKDGQKDDYSIIHTMMDITPAEISIKKVPSLLTDFKKSNFIVPKYENEGAIKGSLLIAGGALGSSNGDVYKKFIQLAKAGEEGKIGIIPAASSSISSSNAFKEDLKKYGVPEKNIRILPLSNHDLKGTPDDESKWKENQNNESVANEIKTLNGIWFVGGDQTNITAALLNGDGSKSQALQAIWDIYQKGAVIGGTSAGAAVMSGVMIAGGGSLDTLTNGFTDTYDGEQQQEGGPAFLEKGLGFFQYGIVDQHFDNKARLGRLIAVSSEKGKKDQLSYGIDEDTALVVYNREKRAEVVGRGGVTLLDLSKAVHSNKSSSNFRNILYSYITPGDSVDLKTKNITISKRKTEVNKHEYDRFKAAPLSGVLTPHSLINKFVSYDLLDNSGEKEVKANCFNSNGTGVELRFKKAEYTKGFFGFKDGSKDDYSVQNALLDITPIKASIKEK